MNRLKCAGTLALAMAFMTAGTASAQQPQPCAMMKDHQMGGMQQQGMPGMGMMKQDKQMADAGLYDDGRHEEAAAASTGDEEAYADDGRDDG